MSKLSRKHFNHKWLDTLMDVTEAADDTVVNIILILVFTTFSTLFAMGLACLTELALSWPNEPGIIGLVGAIAAITSFSAAVPGVLFASMMIERLGAARVELSEALTEAGLANRAKSEFLATMSHEIRTPLNGVLGMAQVLEHTQLADHQRELVTDIRSSGALLLSIVNDVLDLSKIEAGKVELAPAVAPLRTMIESAVKLFVARAAEQDTRLDVAFDDTIHRYAAFDAVRVRQCIGNLVSNAVKFTSGGAISVVVTSASHPSGDLLVNVSVSDTGIGMDEAALNRLFKAFSQADSSIQSRFGGTGLGLAISRRLARLMGGDISATSRVGEGSVFTLTFLATPAEPPDLAGESGPAQDDWGRIRDIRILVTDDNAINRRVARLLLAQLGAVIKEASSGAEALELLKCEEFDVVLMDVHMPVMDGCATVRAIRASEASWSTMPVIALTADAMAGERERLLSMGMSGYVAKPIQVAELFTEIERTLAGGLRR